MEWKDISSILLKRFSRFGVQNKVRTIVSEALSETLGVPIPETCLHVKGNKIYVSAHPAIKNELFLKKSKILALIRERTQGAVDEIL